jgi:hypothetical protein
MKEKIAGIDSLLLSFVGKINGRHADGKVALHVV